MREQVLVVLPRLNPKLVELGDGRIVTKLGIGHAVILGLLVIILVTLVRGVHEGVIAVHELRHGLGDLLGVALAGRKREGHNHGERKDPQAREYPGKRATMARRETHG